MIAAHSIDQAEQPLIPSPQVAPGDDKLTKIFAR
jgi:hypothetical protein